MNARSCIWIVFVVLCTCLLPARAATPPELQDLPLIEVLSTNPGDSAAADVRPPLAILLTGAGGWARIDSEISAELAANGVPVVGFDTVRYLWKERSPEECARDVARVMERYTRTWSRQRVVLIGYSLGADILPFIVNRLPDEWRKHVAATVLIGLGDTATFVFHSVDVLPGVLLEGKPLAPELARLDLASVVCLYGAGDRESLCPSLAGKGAHVEQLGTGHHLGGHYRTIAQRILEVTLRSQ